ncbi:MAG: hypothetical protein HY710_07530 [Candidatus Latescibacteria bacterium]|nr:hypothetical protein [Candidatus Latescibacterota bacterium]
MILFCRLPICSLVAGLLIGLLAGPAEALQLNGVVTDGRNPIPGARVRVQGRARYVLTDRNGRFELSEPIDPAATVVVTAGKEGWINNGVRVTGATSFTTIILEKAPDTDDPSYPFISPHSSLVDLRVDETRLASMRVRSHTTFKESCNLCHFEPTCHLCHRELYEQWTVSQHARAVKNSWTQDLYTGTDARGRANVGPGFRVDSPRNAGECADCHAPSAAVRAPGQTDLAVVYRRGVIAYPPVIGYKSYEQVRLEQKAGTVDADGVHCDFCHKIKDVIVNERPGVNGSIKLGRNRFQETTQERAREGRLPAMLVYGPFDDVISFSPVSQAAITSPMVASYAPIYASSAFCSACHQHTNEHGIPVQATYQEWKESPYPAANVQCQDCHMKPRPGTGNIVTGDADKFWTPVHDRDPSTVKRHDFPGATPELLKDAATLSVEGVISSGVLTATVSVKNVNVGHNLPSGIAIRNLLLLVTPVSADGDTLRYLGTERVPDYGGLGPSSRGNYAGYPGRGFALVFTDRFGRRNVMDWQATKIAADTRIRPKATDTSVYRFAVPPNAGTITIQTQLLYRRAYKPLADIKGWKLNDLLVASDRTVVTPRMRVGAAPPSGKSRFWIADFGFWIVHTLFRNLQSIFRV